jgi:aspartate racemase
MTSMVPVLHIADATAEVLVNDGIKQVGLLGAKFIMEHAFYKENGITLPISHPNSTG